MELGNGCFVLISKIRPDHAPPAAIAPLD